MFADAELGLPLKREKEYLGGRIYGQSSTCLDAELTGPDLGISGSNLSNQCCLRLTKAFAVRFCRTWTQALISYLPFCSVVYL